SSALQLNSARICILAGTTSVANARAYFEGHNIKIELMEFDKREDALKAYEKRDCDALSADRSALASQRSSLKDAEDHVLLPEVISKEPLGPAVRQDDPAWAELVRWVVFLLINAEETGWSSTDVARTPDASPIAIPDAVNAKLGLDKNWPRAVIGSVGNYAEIFQNNVGDDSPLRIRRGINALWNQGGILYAPPMR
ncbi:MAG: transporter substrate-binding domain-containing protein, partial [Hyphomicrobiales bacterium]